MWIKTAEGKLVNLAQAYDVEYNPVSNELTVWFSGDFPADGNRDERSGLYDTSRLKWYRVAQGEWERFCRVSLPIVE